MGQAQAGWIRSISSRFSNAQHSFDVLAYVMQREWFYLSHLSFAKLNGFILITPPLHCSPYFGKFFRSWI